ncbi:MAG: hypothetical protein JXN61_17515 [Sedimentisphaerales bacterium]|nr:hypothetical protein [Sedimentisphaerales bacterium]
MNALPRVSAAMFVMVAVSALPLHALAVVDDFDDNVRDTAMWDYVVVDWQGELSEVNGRLEYTSPAATNGAPEGENSAYYKLKTPPAYGSAWVLTLDVHVELYDSLVPPASYEYGMEVGIFNGSDPDDRLWVGRARGYDGAATAIDNSWVIAKAANDVYTIGEFFQADANDGTIKIVWSGEKLAVYRREGSGEAFELLMDGIELSDWGMSSGDTFEIFIGGWDTEHPTALDDGDKLYCDNFAINQFAGAYYETQTVVFFDPNLEFVFLPNSDGVNSLAGEDYGAVRFVAVNDNDNSQNLAVPAGGFRGNQGVVIGYDVVDDSGNGAFCMITEDWPADEGGPGGSGVPASLSDSILYFDLAFTVPGVSGVGTLNEVISYWIIEADGDHFETEGIVDVSAEWQRYSYDLNNLAAHPTFAPGGGVFGDSPVILLSIQFEDPDTIEDIESILYFIDNVTIVGESDFFEGFEDKCSSVFIGDLNGDCIVNFIDFGLMAGDWLEDGSR